MGPTLQRHPFSGLVDSAGELDTPRARRRDPPGAHWGQSAPPRPTRLEAGRGGRAVAPWEGRPGPPGPPAPPAEAGAGWNTGAPPRGTPPRGSAPAGESAGRGESAATAVPEPVAAHRRGGNAPGGARSPAGGRSPADPTPGPARPPPRPPRRPPPPGDGGTSGEGRREGGWRGREERGAGKIRRAAGTAGPAAG
ncbi:unnamed protein product, partial [Rangifer tarandus platyrhynchus]